MRGIDSVRDFPVIRDPHLAIGTSDSYFIVDTKAIGGKEGKGSRRIFVRLQGATAGA